MRGGARERILEAAYRLFSRNGINAVGVDLIVEEAGVAKMTLYRHFASKEELVLAFLDLREQRWTREWLQRRVEASSEDPTERLLAVFDVLEPWLRSNGYEACSFVTTLMEARAGPPAIRHAAVAHLETIRDLLQAYAAAAGVAEPGTVAGQVQILMFGAVVSAARGDRAAAGAAREVARALLDGGRQTDRGGRRPPA